MRQSLNHSVNTLGGRRGHLMRRMIHVFMLIIPVVYYYWGVALAEMLHTDTSVLIGGCLVLILALECLRIYKRHLFFGQRTYEVGRISSFAWGALAMALVLWSVPHAIYAIPLVAGCALGDPLMGVLKRYYPWYVVSSIAFLVIAFIWWVSGHWMPLPIWFPGVIAVITVAAEWPNLQWIDDNALMQLLPLVVLCWAIR